jgi:hypothetical protein
MHRIRSLFVALAALAVTAGLVTAHAMPAASNGGLDTARQASGKQVPLGVGAGASHDNTTNVAPDTAGAPPAGTHGADVSAAAKAPTPAGDWANHGAYVSSIAQGWGQTTSAAHKNPNASGDPTNHLPTAAATGLSHRN